MRLWPAAVRQWGSTPAERDRAFPCDRHLRGDSDAIFRAVDVGGPSAVVFRWLCQLRVAPYSYDRLDNRGRRSPQELTPGLEELEVGQRFMTIFRLVDFEEGRSITLRHEGPVFGRIAATYLAEGVAPGQSRLIVKMLVAYPRAPLGPLARLILPPGDLVMMRRQLLNLKRLAESERAAA